MIKLNLNTTNNIVLTLTENATISNPFYLFEFEYDMSGDVDTFLAENISVSTERFDRFKIIVNTSGSTSDSSGSTIAELVWNEYKGNNGSYKVHQVLTPTLDLNDSIGILEVGKFLIESEPNEVEEITYNNDNTKNIVYNNNN